ncbi:S9 family peptidase [Actinoplanes subtropicus]|uniref:S9 family peptidase n=1 Tax=Actinoplanes subtropicus TaxID=543632 RepID=UPI0004C3675B|nr:prolyl oligopeptidase family serine peptidase [Actinoplanes subtropicus]
MSPAHPNYPSLLARTQRFRLGRPTRLTLTPDGRRVFFLRSRGSEDPVRCLWQLDLETGAERLLADPRALGTTEAEPSAQEQTRRERARDQGSGIAAYNFDQAVRVIACTIGEELYVVGMRTGTVTPLAARTPLTDATISPDGVRVAYVHDGELRLIGTDGADDRSLATPESPDVTYGLAEHVAAESMERHRGYWWSPAGDRLAVARVDNAPVGVWYLSDPASPEKPPAAHRYPAAGTNNALVTLWVYGVGGERVAVDFGWDDYEYLVDVVWDRHGLLAVLQNRPQTVLRTVAVDPDTGRVSTLAESRDPAWTQIVPGVPVRTASGALVATADLEDTRHLTVDGNPVTPAGLQVSEVHGADDETVLFSATDEPTERHLWTWSPAGGLTRVTTTAGIHSGIRTAGTTVISSATLDGHAVTATTRNGHAATRTVKDFSATSPVVPQVNLMRTGERELRTAVLLPSGWRGESLPVLMDPYGGPADQRALADRDRYYASQWFADQGFAVIVADGRGTPGRGPRWERTVHGDRATLLLEDQIAALHGVAERYPSLELGSVAIRGWSAGGYLAALAVLRRPDVFHVGVAGAPVTDMRLYDTHWQERFLGDPRTDAGTYENSSLIADARRLTRPLMLIHGLRDDNVYPAHTLRLSAALLAAGRPHTVLPLPGGSHMPPGIDLLTQELIFIREALAIARTGS